MNSIETQQNIFPNWMRGFLLAAAAYNVLWGIFIGWCLEMHSISVKLKPYQNHCNRNELLPIQDTL